MGRAGSSPAFGTKHKKDKSNPRNVRGLLLCFFPDVAPHRVGRLRPNQTSAEYSGEDLNK